MHRLAHLLVADGAHITLTLEEPCAGRVAGRIEMRRHTRQWSVNRARGSIRSGRPARRMSHETASMFSLIFRYQNKKPSMLRPVLG
jgi:hypothetical protein